MDTIELIIADIFKVVMGALGFTWKMVNVLLWAIAGVFILPCVFIAGNIYPMWENWAKNLKK